MRTVLSRRDAQKHCRYPAVGVLWWRMAWLSLPRARALRSPRRSATRGSEIAGLTLAFLLIACAAAAADCTCRAQGRDYHHGQRVCLASPDGPRLAVCGMDQNVASWKFSDQPCIVSALPPRTLALATPVPH